MNPQDNNQNPPPKKEIDYGKVFAKACVTAAAFTVVTAILGPIAGGFAAAFLGGACDGNS